MRMREGLLAGCHGFGVTFQRRATNAELSVAARGLSWNGECVASTGWDTVRSLDRSCRE